MRAYVQRLLAGSYEVEAFGDGETALATALKNPPDLVLTDIMMPRLDGLALLQALRADPRTRNVPVILLSARAGEESRLEGLEAGAYDYLIKPFSARELLAQVSSRLELARLHRDARERERFIEQIAELTPVVLSVFDLVTERDVYISRDVTTLSGYTGDELKQMQDPFSTLWHPDDIPRHRDHLARWKRMADGEIFEFQFRVRHRDGRWRWLETRSMPFCRSEAGDVRQIVAATLDVTARKQAEEALCASEERFRRYFELGLIGMAITSPEKGCIEVNDEICRILGYQRDELLRMTWAELTHPDDLAADIANFNHVMAGEIDGYSMDKRWVRKDGQAIYSTISVECVRREDRSVDYFVALLQDITARKRAEEDLAKAYDDLERRVVERTAQLTAINKELRNEVIERKRTEGLLREANQRIEMILDTISDNFFSLDKDFRFSYLNKRAQEQVKRLGKDPERLIGKVLWDEFKDVPNEAAIRRVISERVAIHDELYYPPLKEWVENHMYPRRDGGLASFQRYITDRKRAEAESLALKDALADELAAMTRLHEFSTRMLASTELQPLLEEVLNAIISLQKADFGNIQLYNMESQTLEIVAQRGFQQDFLDHFRSVHDDGAACGRAMQGRERIIIEDVQTDPKFEPHRAIAASAGFRAVQSTPLFTCGGELVGMISTHFRQPHRPSEHELRFTDLYAVHAAELIARKQSEAAVFRYQQELQALTAKLIEAQEQESKHLARELHDVFSQKLAVLGLEVAAFGQKPPESPQALKGRLQQLTKQIGVLSKDIQNISRQLHPAILDDLGLEAALRNECLMFSEQHGIPAEFVSRNVPRALPGDVSLCLYRVTQESLRNIGKHAQADDVRVNLTAIDGEIVLAINDLGDGFDLQEGRGRGGLGLVSMEERTRMVNGTFSIRSHPGKGTRVEVRAPLHQREL
jgi:PAS domain S-box-containing protein